MGDCKSIEFKATNLCTSSSCFPDLHPAQPRRQITCTLLILQYLYLYFVFLSPPRPSYLNFGCICIFCILNRPSYPRHQNIYIQMHYSHLTISVIYFYFFLSFIMCVFVFVFISIFVFLSITFFQDRWP